MYARPNNCRSNGSGRFLPLLVALPLLLSLWSCGGSTSLQFSSAPPRGTVSVSISDPPSCKVPAGNYRNVWITIRSVQAHISATADDSSTGWQELAPNLANAPVQIDLLAASGGCTLAQLGSNVSLPAGDFQQIRLILLSNNPAAGSPAPAMNHCGNQGWNCAVLADNSVHQLNLSSQANTGLKIPPGQIVGGPIRVAANQHVDINIDFNVCASIVVQGNGQFRLRPTLTAGQVSSQGSGISGQVVDSATMQPLNGGTVQIALEQADSTGTDRVIMQAATDATGNFNFCPVPAGMYDIVATGTDGAGVSYSATVVLNVSNGTSLGKIPLLAQSGASTGPGTITGSVTAQSGTAPMVMGANIDAGFSALQSVPLSGGGMRNVTIPLQGMSTPTAATASGGMCPMNTNCASYTLIVPAANASIGAFSMSGTTYSMPAAGDVLYIVEARATVPMSGGTATCMPSTKAQDKDSMDQPLKVTAGASTTAKSIDFTGCS